MKLFSKNIIAAMTLGLEDTSRFPIAFEHYQTSQLSRFHRVTHDFGLFITIS